MTTPLLEPYGCTGWNRRTGRPCDAVLIHAWSSGGALVRRRCHQCGTWQDVTVHASAPTGLAAWEEVLPAPSARPSLGAS